MMMMKQVLLVIMIALLTIVKSSHSYANQTRTYTAMFQPLTLSNVQSLNISAFFSPDFSASTLTELIEKANRQIVIANPSFSSWSGCTYGKECYGCTAEKLRNEEKFPVFQALVNAINVRNITVKILTNDPGQYGDVQCDGKMSLLTFLAIAGAQVKYYTSTSFMHAKFVSIDDGEWVSISSINFSKTSIMSNREAGMNIYKNKDIAAFTSQVFNYDFDNGVEIQVPWTQYTEDDIATVRNRSQINVVVPEPYHFKYCNAETPAPAMHTISTSAQVTVTASPDYAYDTLVDSIKSAKKSLSLSIYEVSSPELCDLLLSLSQRGVDLKLFVSNDVYGKSEKEDAHVCYKKLYSNNILIKLSHPYCLTYSHQKYWIIDNALVGLSTGNWRGSDYPTPPYVFPAPGQPNYRPVNRDFTISVSSIDQDGTVHNNHLLSTFQKVFDQDYDQGVAFDPSKTS